MKPGKNSRIDKGGGNVLLDPLEIVNSFFAENFSRLRVGWIFSLWWSTFDLSYKIGITFWHLLSLLSELFTWSLEKAMNVSFLFVKFVVTDVKKRSEGIPFNDTVSIPLYMD